MAALTLLAFAPVAQAQSWSESELQEMYMKFLSDEGIDDAFIDSDGDVQFTFSGHNMYIEVNEDDNEFFRVVAFNLWPIESQTEAVQVAFAVDAVNRERFVAKAYTLDDNVWIACEAFFGRPEQFKPVFMRMLREIERGIDVFVENM